MTNLVNVRYLTGFTGTNGAALVSRDERLFFTDFRYVERARLEVREFDPVEGGRDLISGQSFDALLAYGIAAGLAAVFWVWSVRGLRKAEAAGG